MWLFTRYGFFSCVCGHPEAPRSGPQLDVIMVRARDRAHLEALIARVQEAGNDTGPEGNGYATPELVAAFKAPDIVESTDTDYRFRVVIPRMAFAPLMALLADDVDYDNFKGATAALQGRSMYEESLHQVWGTMYRLQAAKYPGGLYGRTRARAPRAARNGRLPNQPKDDPQEAGLFKVGPDDGEEVSLSR